MIKAKYVPPKIIQKIFYETIWETKNDKILITFDDGPTPETTPVILEKLKSESLKAVFFCVGENVERYPQIAKNIIADGHLIGNHTASHRNINFFNKHAESEISRCSKIIKDTTGRIPEYFRPPHGRIGFRTESILNKQNLKNVMWTLLTEDYKNSFNIVKFAIRKYLKANSIVVFHDSPKSQDIILDSIDFLLEEVAKRRFTIGEPLECLK